MRFSRLEKCFFILLFCVFISGCLSVPREGDDKKKNLSNDVPALVDETEVVLSNIRPLFNKKDLAPSTSEIHTPDKAGRLRIYRGMVSHLENILITAKSLKYHNDQDGLTKLSVQYECVKKNYIRKHIGDDLYNLDFSSSISRINDRISEIDSYLSYASNASC